MKTVYSIDNDTFDYGDLDEAADAAFGFGSGDERTIYEGLAVPPIIADQYKVIDIRDIRVRLLEGGGYETITN